MGLTIKAINARRIADNGGPTQNHGALPAPRHRPGDAASCPATDQRGRFSSPGKRCDIGAYDYDRSCTPTPTPTVTPPYSYHPLYLSLTSSQTIGGVSSRMKTSCASWHQLSLYFRRLRMWEWAAPTSFAFSIVDADTILMSFSGTCGKASPHTAGMFCVSMLLPWQYTAGTFSLYFDWQ